MKKSHICSTCSAKFSKRSDLVRHDRVHTGVRPFKCEECGNSFTQRSSLKTHRRKHTGERPYQCHVCRSTFVHSHRLKSHLQRLHSSGDEDAKPSHFRRHLRVDLANSASQTADNDGSTQGSSNLIPRQSYDFNGSNATTCDCTCNSNTRCSCNCKTNKKSKPSSTTLDGISLPKIVSPSVEHDRETPSRHFEQKLNISEPVIKNEFITQTRFKDLKDNDANHGNSNSIEMETDSGEACMSETSDFSKKISEQHRSGDVNSNSDDDRLQTDHTFKINRLITMTPSSLNEAVDTSSNFVMQKPLMNEGLRFTLKSVNSFEDNISSSSIAQNKVKPQKLFSDYHLTSNSSCVKLPIDVSVDALRKTDGDEIVNAAPSNTSESLDCNISFNSNLNESSRSSCSLTPPLRGVKSFPTFQDHIISETGNDPASGIAFASGINNETLDRSESSSVDNNPVRNIYSSSYCAVDIEQSINASHLFDNEVNTPSSLRFVERSLKEKDNDSDKSYHTKEKDNESDKSYHTKEKDNESDKSCHTQSLNFLNKLSNSKQSSMSEAQFMREIGTDMKSSSVENTNHFPNSSLSLASVIFRHPLISNKNNIINNSHIKTASSQQPMVYTIADLMSMYSNRNALVQGASSNGVSTTSHHSNPHVSIKQSLSFDRKHDSPATKVLHINPTDLKANADSFDRPASRVDCLPMSSKSAVNHDNTHFAKHEQSNLHFHYTVNDTSAIDDTKRKSASPAQLAKNHSIASDSIISSTIDKAMQIGHSGKKDSNIEDHIRMENAFPVMNEAENSCLMSYEMQFDNNFSASQTVDQQIDEDMANTHEIIGDNSVFDILTHMSSGVIIENSNINDNSNNNNDDNNNHNHNIDQNFDIEITNSNVRNQNEVDDDWRSSIEPKLIVEKVKQERMSLLNNSIQSDDGNNRPSEQTEIQLNCSSKCPLGLFDTNVISDVCKDQCFGEIIQRSSGSEDETENEDLENLRSGPLRTENVNQLSDSNVHSGPLQDSKTAMSNAQFIRDDTDMKSSPPKNLNPITSSIVDLDGIDVKTALFSYEQSGDDLSVEMSDPHITSSHIDLNQPNIETKSSSHADKNLGNHNTDIHDHTIVEIFPIEIDDKSKNNTFDDFLLLEKKSMSRCTDDAFNRIANKNSSLLSVENEEGLQTATKNSVTLLHNGNECSKSKNEFLCCDESTVCFIHSNRKQSNEKLKMKKHSGSCQYCHNSFLFHNGIREAKQHPIVVPSLNAVNMSVKGLEFSESNDDKVTLEKISSEVDVISKTPALSANQLQNPHVESRSRKSKCMNRKENSHRKIAELYLCHICGVSESSLKTLENHINISHNNNGDNNDSTNYKNNSKLSYKCSFCDTTFNKKANLKRHSQIHSRERPFSCKKCSKSFTQRANLQVHMRVHTGERPYSCKLCPEDFAHSQALKLHMRSHLKDKRFICPTCDKGFISRAGLNKHVLSHSVGKTKLYSCDFCDSKFSTKPSLSRHVKWHKLKQGLLPFTCTVCSVKFAQTGHLRLHMKMNHKNAETVVERK